MFNQGRVWNRIDRNSLLDEPVEQFTTVPRGPAVESKRVFVEVVVQMLMTDSALMGSQQPPLQQRGDCVAEGQQIISDICVLSYNLTHIFFRAEPPGLLSSCQESWRLN